ncbi:ParB/RepB/Spo0J family partition protein [Streptomyces sp. NPDC004542]|uniref:ParB/RepB/Spo0J family partition protein n=1 Tax=Streptomyces sp. NPDC004542 TaxID=3154281 RepID=UPI0033B293E1
MVIYTGSFLWQRDSNFLSKGEMGLNRNIADIVPSDREVGSISAARSVIPAEVRAGEVVSIPIASLLPGESPRLAGQDANHVTRLVELDVPLPPILVDRHSLRVIDGMHRLMAAFLKGQEAIEAELFDGTPAEAFLRAVEANVTHGLPLSKEDRRAAAVRIIASHPEMSDRAIARAAGLGAKAVAVLRRSSVSEGTQLSARIGRDGRVRPLSSTEGRMRAAELIAENPKASLREVARGAGISPATVSDVRKRIMAGESPVAEHERPEPDTEASSVGSSESVQGGTRRAARKVRLLQPDPVPLVDKLLRDPSLRHKEEGRHLLRVLQLNAIGDQEWSKLAAAVPSHCGDLIADLARQYAETWMEFAKELDERIQSTGDETRASM